MPELIGKGKKKECLDSMCLGNLLEHGGIGAGGLRLRHLHLPKLMMGPHGALFFRFQRGLVAANALGRLPKRSKLVSEPHLSLIDRPRLS